MFIRSLVTLVGCVALGCASDSRSAGAGPDGGSASSAGSGFGNAGVAAVSGGAGTTGSLSNGVSGGSAGTTGDVEASTDSGSGGAWDALDASTSMPDLADTPCPTGFECVTDPLIGKLSVCLKSGALPLPVSCTTDAECVAAGLPMGICISEEETGLTGCMQLCMPSSVVAADGGM